MLARAGLLRTHAAFRLLWCARTVSLLGDRFSLFAIPILALDRLHATAGQAALLVAAQSLPGVIVALPAATRLVGRSERATMVGCDLVRGLLLGGAVGLAVVHQLTMAALFACVVAVGATSTVFDVAAQAYMPRIVDRADYLDANSRLAQADGGTWVAGPVLVGILIGTAGPVAAIGVDAASFAVSWFLLIRIKDPRSSASSGGQAEGDEEEAGPWRRLVSGYRFAVRQRGVRAIVIAATLFNLGGAMVGALWFPYLLRLLRIQPALIGVLSTIGGASALVTVLVLRRVMRSVSLAVVLPASLATGVFTLWLIPLASRGHAIWLLAGYQLIFSAAAAAFGVVAASTRQLLTPQRYQGRVYAFSLVLAGVAVPLGSVLASVVADSTSVLVAIVVGTLVASVSLVTVRALAASTSDSRQAHQ
jgi:hypothetical protein